MFHKSCKIKIKTLNNYINQNNIAYISYLKLDIEGNELSALEGAKDYLLGGFIKIIHFEYGGCSLDSRTYLRDFFLFF